MSLLQRISYQAQGKIPDVRRLLEKAFKNVLNVDPNEFVEDKESTISKVTEFLAKEKSKICELIIKNIGDTLNEQSIPYSPEIDKICLIVDRDPLSFTSSQFDYVKSTCETNNVQLYINNPDFELWLLMHSQNFHSLVKSLNDKFETSEPHIFQDYVEDLLKQEFLGYSKSKFKAFAFMMLIDTAIANEKAFTEKVADLKDSLGTNVGLLLQEMRNTSNN